MGDDKGVEKFDTSFEVALDDEPGPAPPVFVDVVAAKEPIKRPIIPPHLRGVDNIKRSAGRAVGGVLYRVRFHAVRTPVYVLLAVLYAVKGVFVGAGRQVRWAWYPEMSTLLQEAATKKDIDAGVKVDKALGKVRKSRGSVLLAEALAVVAGVYVLVNRASPLLIALVVVVAVPVLAHYGRPADKPIVGAAIVTPRYRRLNSDVVLRAYYAAKLGDPDKPGQQITFGSQMARDARDVGSQVVVDVPHGTTFSDVMNRREKIASGLDVSLSQVYLTRDKSSNRRHLLWVADVDPLSIPAGRTPLLDCKPRDVWNPAPLGLDERGRRVSLPLVFTSVLIGAQPRKGKTFTARVLALFAALDPFVRLSVFDGKGSPDWRKFVLVAYTYGFGLLPDRLQGEPVENLRATLRAAWREILERNARLSELPTSVCPEGKLTREIARDRRYGMPVWMIILDEFQEYLNTGDEEADLEIADLLLRCVKVGPSVGVIVVSSTQKPSGIGSTGKVAKRFTDYRDNHLTRFALKTGNYNVSDAVLGGGAYQEGYDSSVLPVGDDYRGIGILYDAPVDNATVRTFLADGEDAEKILTAARRYREKAGTLDGMAAGEAVAVQARDPLTDVLDAFGVDETFVSWATLAARLAEQMPERYADVTARALSDTVTGLGLGIESKSGQEKGGGDARPRGVYLAALRRAVERRAAENQ